MADNRKGKNSKAKAKKAVEPLPAPVNVKSHRPKDRRVLLVWAEIMEKFADFEDDVYDALDAEILAEWNGEDIKDAICELRGELFNAMPQKWW